MVKVRKAKLKDVEIIMKMNTKRKKNMGLELIKECIL
jgi:hypothetical protein